MEKLKERARGILRWSERYIKTDMVYMAKSSFWLLTNQILGALASFVLSILFAHFVSKETYGMYKYVLSIAGTAAAFSLSGMNIAVTQAVAKGREGIFVRSLWVQAKWSVLSGLVALGFGIYYFAHADPAYGLCFIIVALLYPLSTVANTYNAYLQGKKDFRTSAEYGVWSSLIYLIILGAAIVFSLNLVILVLAYYVATAASNVLFCFRTLSKDRPNKEMDRADLTFGKHVSLMNAVAIAAAQIDSILVYFLLGPTDLAIYSFAIIMPDRIRSLFGFISSAALPKIAAQDRLDPRIMLKKTIPVAVGTLAIIILYVLFAPLLFHIFFPAYYQAIRYSQIYSLSIIGIVALFAAQALFAHRRKKELYVLSVGGPLLKIVLVYFLILNWGIMGAIIARTLAYVIYTAIPLGVFVKESKRGSPIAASDPIDPAKDGVV